MNKLIVPIQPLILTTAGQLPTVPTPSSIMPSDSRFNKNSDLMVGQLAYNVIDDLWYYRSYSAIKQLLGGTALTPSNVEVFDPSKAYSAGSIYVSYINALSSDPEFQIAYIYRCVAATSAGESPESHPAKWERQGEIVNSDNNTADIFVSGEMNSSIQSVTGYSNGHGIISKHNGLLYEYDENATSGIKPNNHNNATGRWVVIGALESGRLMLDLPIETNGTYAVTHGSFNRINISNLVNAVTIALPSSFSLNNAGKAPVKMSFYFNNFSNSSDVAITFTGNLGARHWKGSKALDKLLAGKRYVVDMYTLTSTTVIAEYKILNENPVSTEVIEVDNVQVFDPAKVDGYLAGEFVSYRNETSLIPQFQTFAIYLAQQDVAMGISPEDDTVNWEWQGVEVVINNETTSVISVEGTNSSIQTITGYNSGHGVLSEETGILHKFDPNATTGLRPFDITDPLLPGRWVEQSSYERGRIARDLSTTNGGNYEIKFGEHIRTSTSSLVSSVTFSIPRDARSFVAKTPRKLSMFISNISTNPVAISFVPLVSGAVYWKDSLALTSLLANKRYYIEIERSNLSVYVAKYHVLDTEASVEPAITDHSLLTNLQGGTTGEYYHLNQTQYNKVADLIYSNSVNSLSVLTAAVERGVSTPVSIRYNMLTNDDIFNTASIDNGVGSVISRINTGNNDVLVGNFSNNNTFTLSINYTRKGISTNETKTATFSTHVPKWSGVSSTSVINTYALASANLPKVLTGVTAMNNTGAASGQYIWFITTNSAALVYDSNGFSQSISALNVSDLTKEFLKRSFTLILLDNTTVTMYSYRSRDLKTFSNNIYRIT